MKAPPGRSSGIVAMIVACALPLPNVLPAQDTIARALPPVVVTRDRARSPLDLPYGITSLRPDSVSPGQTHTQVEQSLAFVPGLTTANRNNPSQDTRVSIRGFGARSPFGVRSVRVLRDGMPLTLPDGQTPLDYLDLESVGRVEVIRGSAAALYGNAAGGVIDLRSGPPPSAPLALQGRSWFGSSGLQRYTALWGGTSGASSYSGNVGRTVSDGFRAHARQRLTNGFGRATANVGGTDVTIIAMGLDMPLAENPGALTRAQFDTAPEMADQPSVAKRARKEVRQGQLGISARRDIHGNGEFLAQAYGGARHLYNPLTFAIVGIERGTAGGSMRVTVPIGTDADDVRESRHRLTIGADAQRLSDARKNWSNCNALAVLTPSCVSFDVEQGALQLDQREIVTAVGPYVRDEIDLGLAIASLGVRADNTTFEVRDHFLGDGRDDSGKRSMRAVSPMLGVAFRLDPSNALYVSGSTAFETPTTTELGNRSDGSAGLNADLKPQYSTTVEAGLKGEVVSRLRYDVALYSTSVRDELIPFDIGNGRTAFRNAGRTQRRGGEIAAQTEVGRLALTAAYSFSHFRFVEFVTGTTPQNGHTIPGVPAHQAQTSATWRLTRGFATAELLAKSKVYVNDANDAAAPGYAIVNLRAGATAIRGRPWLTPVVGVQNVFDRKYVGSVAINAAGTAASAKFYEPAPGRSWFAGLSAATALW